MQEESARVREHGNGKEKVVRQPGEETEKRRENRKPERRVGDRGKKKNTEGKNEEEESEETFKKVKSFKKKT